MTPPPNPPERRRVDESVAVTLRGIEVSLEYMSETLGRHEGYFSKLFQDVEHINKAVSYRQGRLSWGKAAILFVAGIFTKAKIG